MCPPNCKDDDWFKQLVGSYKKAIICYEILSYNDKFDLTSQRNNFNLSLINLEQQLKREGNFFALSFISGGCMLCEDKLCSLAECNRVNYGRTPVCALGLDIQHVGEQILLLEPDEALSFWKANLSKSLFDPASSGYLCLGLLFY
jgi:predicted metal-binding protein